MSPKHRASLGGGRSTLCRLCADRFVKKGTSSSAALPRRVPHCEVRERRKNRTVLDFALLMCVYIYIYTSLRLSRFVPLILSLLTCFRKRRRERAKKKKKSYVAQNNLADVEKQCAHCWIFLCRLQLHTPLALSASTIGSVTPPTSVAAAALAVDKECST